MASFSDTFPPIELALQLEPEELAQFVLKHVGSMRTQLNRHNYTTGTAPEFIAYAGEHRERFLHRLMEAWMWLERELFIAPKPGVTGDWVFLTRKAERVLAGEDFSSYRQAFLLPGEDLDPILVRKARPLFIRGDYELAVFQAFKEVEVRVRTASKLSKGLIGQRLMREAFRPEEGPLTDMSAEASERQGAADLFAGAVALFKNPSSHRDVDFNDPKEAADLIHFANQLLRMIDRRISGPDQGATP